MPSDVGYLPMSHRCNGRLVNPFRELSIPCPGKPPASRPTGRGISGDPPLDHHAPTARKPLLSTSFTLADLNRVRHEVEAVSRRCGLDHDDIENWVIAVNELDDQRGSARGRQQVTYACSWTASSPVKSRPGAGVQHRSLRSARRATAPVRHGRNGPVGGRADGRLPPRRQRTRRHHHPHRGTRPRHSDSRQRSTEKAGRQTVAAIRWFMAAARRPRQVAPFDGPSWSMSGCTVAA